MNAIVLTILFYLTCADSRHYVDYRIAGSRSRLEGRQGQIVNFTCPSRGIFCDGCDSIVSCQNMQAPKRVQTCIANQTSCNDELAFPACSDKPSRKCSDVGKNKTFICADYGVYPDPIDCNKYQICVNKSICASNATTTVTPGNSSSNTPQFIAMEVTCPGNYSFNPQTHHCDKALPGGLCPKAQYPVRLCQYPGEVFVIQGPLYAECMQYSPSLDELYPFQYTCKTGKPYSIINYSC